ncbi:MAG: hypothetical protein AAFO63_10185, partial [Pseudomonadota bacterium]
VHAMIATTEMPASARIEKRVISIPPTFQNGDGGQLTFPQVLRAHLENSDARIWRKSDHAERPTEDI